MKDAFGDDVETEEAGDDIDVEKEVEAVKDAMEEASADALGDNYDKDQQDREDFIDNVFDDALSEVTTEDRQRLRRRITQWEDEGEFPPEVLGKLRDRLDRADKGDRKPEWEE